MHEQPERAPTFKERILAKDPRCVFCGGTAASETVDHVPHRGMFTGKHRPKGLEFGACRACNEGARKFEQLAQLVSLFELDEKSSARHKNFDKVVGTALRNFPALKRELYERTDIPGHHRRIANQMLPGAIIVNARGPTLNKAMVDFAAKLGLAFHREVTDKLVPPQGFVIGAWYTNLDVATGYAKPPLEEYLSVPRELRQGVWTTSEQFRYASAWTKDGEASMHRAVFRDVFAVDAIVGTDPSIFTDPLRSKNVRRPGFLRRLAASPVEFATRLSPPVTERNAR